MEDEKLKPKKFISYFIVAMVIIAVSAPIIVEDEQYILEATSQKEYWESDATFNENTNKILYLTFDDGPSQVTNSILDILKDKGVKATFFVVGYKIKGREDTIFRIKNEGHSIGLHSYTHDYKKVYSSQKVFLEEMDKTFKEIKDLTGLSAYAIRFPAGSINRLNEELLSSIHRNNYKIYDWNACISDGIDGGIPPNQLYEESTKVIGDYSRIILLMHCAENNNNTCKALSKIIDYYINEGCEFKTIEEDTPEYIFKIRK